MRMVLGMRCQRSIHHKVNDRRRQVAPIHRCWAARSTKMAVIRTRPGFMCEVSGLGDNHCNIAQTRRYFMNFKADLMRNSVRTAPLNATRCLSERRKVRAFFIFSTYTFPKLTLQAILKSLSSTTSWSLLLLGTMRSFLLSMNKHQGSRWYIHLGARPRIY